MTALSLRSLAMTCHEGEAGSIVDADVDELPTDAAVTIDLAGLSAGDAMTDGAEAAELLDVDVDQLAGLSRS